MVTIKSFTDLEQSKVLVKILPLESADMYYINSDINKIIIRKWKNEIHDEDDIPCWSLASLLDVLQKIAYSIDEDANVRLFSYKTVEWDLGIDNSDLELIIKSNPIDACYEMIIRLNKLKML